MMNEIKKISGPEDKVIDAHVLYYMDIQPTITYVENLLTQGLTLVAAQAKAHKSWMMMQLGLALVEGKPFLERATLRCDVLYYSLEDTWARLQERLRILSDGPAEGLHLSRECPSIGDALISELDERLAVYPQIGVIIIDTLQCIRGTYPAMSNLYCAEYDDIRVLKEFADKYNVAIVVVHHSNKSQGWGNPLARVSGSSALVGCADAIWTLSHRRNTSDHIVLHVVGRDIPQQQIGVRCDNGVWKLVEEEDRKDKRSADGIIDRIITYVMERKTWSGTSSELLVAIGANDIAPSAIGKILKKSDEKLERAKIEYTTARTKAQRIITLRYVGRAGGEGYD